MTKSRIMVIHTCVTDSGTVDSCPIALTAGFPKIWWCPVNLSIAYYVHSGAGHATGTEGTEVTNLRHPVWHETRAFVPVSIITVNSHGWVCWGNADLIFFSNIFYPSTENKLWFLIIVENKVKHLPILIFRGNKGSIAFNVYFECNRSLSYALFGDKFRDKTFIFIEIESRSSFPENISFNFAFVYDVDGDILNYQCVKIKTPIEQRLNLNWVRIHLLLLWCTFLRMSILVFLFRRDIVIYYRLLDKRVHAFWACCTDCNWIGCVRRNFWNFWSSIIDKKSLKPEDTDSM